MSTDFWDHPSIARREYRRAGFTLIEMLAVVALIGVLTGIVTPRLTEFIQAAKVTQAIADIKTIEQQVIGFSATSDSLPKDLATIGLAGMLDPWGNPYQYLVTSGNGKGGGNAGGGRMDRSLHPLNSDFDLYSLGADGKSVQPITAKPSQDDIIRANDGGYVGLARNY